jgi:hypothetical protein
MNQNMQANMNRDPEEIASEVAVARAELKRTRSILLEKEKEVKRLQESVGERQAELTKLEAEVTPEVEAVLQKKK